MKYQRKNAMHFVTLGPLTVSWVWRRKLRPCSIEPLRLPRDHIELALGLTAIALAGIIGALPLVVWLLQETMP